MVEDPLLMFKNACKVALKENLLNLKLAHE